MIYLPHTQNAGEELLTGNFAPNSTSNPTTFNGRNFTVTYQSTGTWRVTADVEIAGWVGIDPTLEIGPAVTQLNVLRITNVTQAAGAGNSYFEIQHLRSTNTTTVHPALADLGPAGTINIYFVATYIRVAQPDDGI